MPQIDPDALIGAVKDAASKILRKDVESVQGFSKTQLEMLANQAAWIAEATLAGDFRNNAPLRDFFLDNLKNMTENFVAVLKGLAALTVEKLINAVVKVVWDSLDKAVGFKLPRPL